MSDILVLFYSKHGTTEKLARAICEGIESVSGVSARLRTIPPVSTNCEATAPEIPDQGPPYAEASDLKQCIGLALGSPTRFGNMAAAMKYFIDGTANEWMAGTLTDKPFCVFTSSASIHGGQETTLLTMAIPLMHHGMVWLGLPYTQKELSETTSGGTPYGVTHVANNQNGTQLTTEEVKLAVAQGKRLANAALKLSSNQ